MMLLVPLGLLAGALTTVAGLGGGMFLVLALSVAWDPLTALTVTAPALLLGNTHRALLYRAHVDRRVALPLVLGALPGSIAGGLLAARLPSVALHALMVGMTLVAVARAAGWMSWRPPRGAIGPAGFGIGALAATSGGAGLLAGPLLMTAGLTGEAYVSTAAAGAVAMHLGRIVAYGATGLFDSGNLARSALLAGAILAGNLVGARARKWLPATATPRIELTALGACVLLSLAGLLPS